MAKDTLFKETLGSPKEFVFDERVAAVFDDMISRSVPHYREVQETTIEVARRFVSPGGVVLDLGCSTGTTLAMLSKELQRKDVRFVGVDNSEAMLAKARVKFGELGIGEQLELQEADLEDYVPPRASVIVMLYTLQFIAPERRAEFVNRVYSALEPGGVFLLTEKFGHPDPEIHELMTELYYDFKRRNGYSDQEISRKREALENVLVPFTEDENLVLLKSAGFEKIELFLKRYNFGSFLAVKKNEVLRENGGYSNLGFSPAGRRKGSS